MASNPVKTPTGVEINGKLLRIVFHYRSKRCRESLGLAPTKQNIAFAKQKREAILYEIKTGTFNYAAHFPNSIHAVGTVKSKDLKSLVDEYLKLKQTDIRGTTYRKYLSVLKKFLLIYGEKRSCETLSPRSLTLYRHNLINELAARTVNRHLVTIKSFLVWLHKMEYIQKNLADVLDRVRENESETKPFTIDEINTVLSVCKQLLTCSP